MLEDDKMCFVCGEKNPIGLHLDWEFDKKEDWLVTSFTPDKKFQGWKDIVHGGILATVLDETMANYCVFKGNSVVSVEINVRFKKSALVGKKLVFKGRARQLKGKLYESEAECFQDGEMVSSATGKLMEIE